ncbi:hypothetical protein EMPG_12907 [Blastomyces silverae]|uniref:ABM domain-containing protein n=1 Tax=Blastomyces silverae TaxID=2060906 RepID=A0A0H1BLP2_9EURO|nr:hypothetical protein EMPG_12907 [Blastomyces silverae]
MATITTPEPFHAISTVAVKPEHAAELTKHWDELCQIVRGKEPDCLTYMWFKVEGKDEYVWVEKFRTRAAYNAHVSSPHVAESFGKWMHLLDGDFGFQRSESGTVGGWQESESA